MSGVSRARISELADKGKAALDAAGAALGNEILTRQRVEMVEKVLDNVRGQVIVQHNALFQRSFLGRLRWLLTGR